ncbi:hypothetical protein AXG93_1862s1210 [Marchantia polymorpha subsp. ruderalis]|uniref:Uncharacterized protein n=1 Tax=Marchantia polymorpha subsp. ruderalis TaxID=1480154 RepID=A0A176W837_MARPO|nr:hypothetical protein AXG93_1862s1210 [Marchantia polymorpha subsp. ruderalis]
MDKSKSKDNLRAAGKKRLEEFRQKKQQKSSATKTTGTALKALAEEEKLLSSTSSSPRTPNHGDLSFKSDEFDSKSDSVPSTPEEKQATAEPCRDSLNNENHHVSAGRNVDSPSIPQEKNNARTTIDTKDVPKTSTLPPLVDQQTVTEEASTAGKFESALELTIPSEITSTAANSNHCGRENAITESKVDFRSSHPTLSQHTPNQGTDDSEPHILSVQAETSGIEKEQGLVQPSWNAEQKFQETTDIKSLIAEIESLQLQLRITQQEKEQLSVDLSSSHGELQNRNEQSAAELSAAQDAMHQAKHRESLLLADLEAAKLEMAQAKGEHVPELERLQRQLIEKEDLTVELTKELASSRELLAVLEEEKYNLFSKVGQFRAELQTLGQEKLHLASELETSNRSLQHVELEKEQLLSERASSIQHIQDLLDKNAQITTELRESVEKFQTFELTREHELEAFRVQITSIQAENARLAQQLDVESTCLNEMRVEKAQLLADLIVEHKELDRFGEGKLELDREIEALKTLVEELRCEKSSMSSSCESEIIVVRMELNRVEAAYSEQANHLTETRKELDRVSEEHVRSISKLELALDECSKMVDCITEEKIKVTEELNNVKSQQLHITEEKELAIANLGNELQESKERFRVTEEQNTSLAKLLEEARIEMQRVVEENARSISELESELDKQRLLLIKDVEEKGRLRGELQEVQEQMMSVQISVRDRQSEIDKHDEELKQLGENRTKLSSDLLMSRDALTRLEEEKSRADLEILGLKDQIAEMDGNYVECVQTLEDTKVELRRVRDHGLQLSRDLEVELERERGMRIVLSEDRDRLTIKLQGVEEQLKVLLQEMEISRKHHETEVLKHEDHLRAMEENHTNLSSELLASRDELSKLLGEKVQAELQLEICKQQLTKLEGAITGTLEKHRGEVATYEGCIKELEESRTMLEDQLLMSQEKLAKLQDEKNQVQLELVAHMEQLKKMEALNQDVGKELAEAKQRVDIHVQERAALLAEHVSQIGSLQEQLNLLESKGASSATEILQVMSDLEALKKEKEAAYSQVEVWREGCMRLEEEKSKIADDLLHSKDQLQLVIRDEELRQAKLSTELETYKENAERLTGEKASLLEELEATREHLRGVNNEKVNEIELLLKQVEELSQSKEHAVNELSAAFQRAEKVERTRTQLVAKLEAVQQHLEDLSKDKDSLITDLDVSRQQYEELDKEKAMMLSSFEVSVNNWKTEKSELHEALEASKELQNLFAAEKDGIASDLAAARERMEDMKEFQAQAAAEIGTLKQSIQSGDDERAQLVAQLSARDQQVQRLVEENSQLTSELQRHSERIVDLTEEIARLTEEMNSYKRKVGESEAELSQLRVESKFPQAQSELSTEEKTKDGEGDIASREVLKLAKEEQDCQPTRESTTTRSCDLHGTVHSVEDLEGLKHQIETKEGELADLKTQYILLQTQLESSDGERHNLAQELVTLRQQLQQLSESKSHVADELALGVEASRQRMLEYEEAKFESSSDMKRSKQDLQALDAEDAENQAMASSIDGHQGTQEKPRSTSNVVLESSAELAGASLKRSPMSKSDDSIVGVGSGVSKLIGEFERKAHAGQEQAEQLRKAVHENLRLTASVERLESERHMLVDAPAQIADLQRQLEELAKQIVELQAEKDEAVGALLAAEAELRQSKEIVKEESLLVADRLEALEESVISLNTERDVLAGTLVDMEKSLIHGSKQTSQEESPCLESLVSNSSSQSLERSELLVPKDVSFLVKKLEKAVFEAFPDASKELASLRDGKAAVDYCDILCDKLLTGDTGVCHQLQKAHLQLTEIRQRLTQSEEKLILVQQERDSVVQAHAQFHERLEQVVEEKEQVKQVQADLCCDVEELVSKMKEATQGYADQLAHQTADKDAVQAEVSVLQARIVELEASLALETTSRSVVNKDLGGIVTKHWGEGADADYEIQSLQQSHQAREIEVNTLNRKVEEAAGTIAQQSDEIKQLLLQTERLSEEMEKINTERASFELSLAQAEQKLSSTREKLSLSVTKGKGVVQQRDALKQVVAEKTKLLESMKAVHEQEMQAKDVALQDMERKLSELQALKEDYIQLETRCSFLQEVAGRAEKVLQNSENLVEGLSALLESSMSSNDWHSWELVEKIVWITSGTSKVVQAMESMKGEMTSLTRTSDTLASTADEAQSRAEILARELSSMKLEKEELVSHFEQVRSNFQLELQQKTDEKAHLTSLIRQFDSEVVTLRQTNESLNRRLEEQATHVASCEGEITTLQKRLAEREEEWHQEVVNHEQLQASVFSIARNLVDIHESLPPFEGDISSAQLSLSWCKEFMHVLVARYNDIVEKLDEIVRQESKSALNKALSGAVSKKHVDQLSLKTVSTDLIKEVEEIFSLVEKQAGEATTLLQRIEKQADELAVAESEKLRLQRELSTAEQRSLTIREKLTSAVTKGKSLVQQRDALKQALAEKTDELASAIISHQKELEFKDAVLHETSQKLAAAMDQVDSLEKQLAVMKTSVSVEKQPSFVEKVSELERLLAETQLKVDLAEAEAESSRKVVDVTSTELEKCQSTVDALAIQVKSVTQEKDDLLQQLERSKTKHMNDIEEYANQRTQLESSIGDLENIIARQKEDMESLMRKFEELNDLYNSLSAQSMEDATETTNLQDEINSLHNHIAELELSMEMEAAARQKLEADSDAVVACIQEVTQEGWGDKTVSLSESNSASSEATSLLEEMSNLLIAKYKAVVQEVEELSEQVSLLSNLEETSKAKTFSEQESLSQMQQMLESKDLELSELSKRMEEAASDMAQQEDVVQGLMQQVNKLRGELAKANGERDALKNELVLAEQRTANTREKLSLAVKKGKNVVQQRDSLKQSFSEQELLLAKCKEELASKESIVSRIKDELMTSNRKVEDLEANVESLMRRTSVLERDMLDKKNLLQALETGLSKYSSGNEWRSKKLTQKVDWLVSAIADAESRALLSSQEAEAARKESSQLRSHLRDTQYEAECEKESLSILTMKLEKTENELQWSQHRTAELEAQLPALASAHQQSEMLMEKIRSLEALLDKKQEKVRNLESILEQKQADMRKAEEAVYAWAGRSEETEAYIHRSQMRISELEAQLRTLSGVQQQAEELSKQVQGLEEVVQQKQSALKALEASRTKAVNKLTTTVNKFRELCKQSEGLVAELERVQGSVESKDAEITQLKEEVGRFCAEARKLQERVDSSNDLLVQLEQRLQSVFPSGLEIELSPSGINKANSVDQGPSIEVEDVFFANVKLIRRRLEAFVAHSQSWQSELAKKDAQLQGLRKELEEANGDRISLKTSLQREQTQFELYKAEFASKFSPAAERENLKVEEIEEVQVGKRSIPSTSAAPQIRGTRKPASFDVAIDMDVGSSRLLEVSDEKGHGFKSLATARFMPRGTRFVADRIDRICAAGGRVLMRQPGARLGLTLYWLAIHIWMALLIATAHV